MEESHGDYQRRNRKPPSPPSPPKSQSFHTNNQQTLLSAAFPTLTPVEATIADCLRTTIPAFVCLGTPDGSTKTVTDYAGLYRAVEKELGLAEKALSHNGKYKVLRREVVKEEVKKLEEAAIGEAKGKGKGKGKK